MQGTVTGLPLGFSLVGGKVIMESYDGGVKINTADPTKGLSVLILSVAMSIDALTVWFSLALLKTPVLYPSIVIGIVAFGMTACGILFGEKLGKIIGRRAEIFGGRC